MSAQSLWAASAATAAASASLTLFAVRRRRDQGWVWWLAAQWGVTLALLLVPAASGSRWAGLLAELMLLQWPLACLAGVPAPDAGPEETRRTFVANVRHAAAELVAATVGMPVAHVGRLRGQAPVKPLLMDTREPADDGSAG